MISVKDKQILKKQIYRMKILMKEWAKLIISKTRVPFSDLNTGSKPTF